MCVSKDSSIRSVQCSSIIIIDTSDNGERKPFGENNNFSSAPSLPRLGKAIRKNAGALLRRALTSRRGWERVAQRSLYRYLRVPPKLLINFYQPVDIQCMCVIVFVASSNDVFTPYERACARIYDGCQNSFYLIITYFPRRRAVLFLGCAATCGLGRKAFGGETAIHQTFVEI